MGFELFFEPHVEMTSSHSGGHSHSGSAEMMASMIISDMIYNMFMYAMGGFAVFHLICSWVDGTVYGEKEKEEV